MFMRSNIYIIYNTFKTEAEKLHLNTYPVTHLNCPESQRPGRIPAQSPTNKTTGVKKNDIKTAMNQTKINLYFSLGLKVISHLFCLSVTILLFVFFFIIQNIFSFSYRDFLGKQN